MAFSGQRYLFETSNRTGDALKTLRQELWDWLVELMAACDKGLCKRYTAFPEWVVQLIAFTLAKIDDPIRALTTAWNVLATQRLKRIESEYEEDRWRLSKLVCRSGFLAAGVAAPSDGALAERLWRKSRDMAVSSWLLTTAHNSFAEIQYGLCHLAAGPIDVPGEPANTLAYLRGEPALLARAVIDLRANNLSAQEVVRACRAAKLDVVSYLELASKALQADDFHRFFDEIRGAAE